MQSLKSAAEVLSRADAVTHLARIAAAAGCDGPAAPLDGATRRALGLGVEVADAHVAAGSGALRALLLELRGGRSLREFLPSLAARLATRAPHVLWLVAAIHRDSSDIAFAAWRDDHRPPRIAALLADRRRIVDSDAETLAALCCSRPGDDLLTHARWVDVLGREALTRRFYLGLERAIHQLASSSTQGSDEHRLELALLQASRLLFLTFVEAKGWLNGERDFLRARLDECTVLRGGFQRRVLTPLFFGTLNTPPRQRAPAARAFGRVPFLNGGLFARTPIERGSRGIVFSDAAYGTLVHDLFGRYRFTAHEESSDWAEVAVDPEMLGRAFETLMAARERKSSGAYFTPHDLVVRTTRSALREVLARFGSPEISPDSTQPVTTPHSARLAPLLDRIALLDPACGSGAFLVHALEELAALRTRLGDSRPLAEIRRHVLTSSIFGVDVNPVAVWLCELRLWLSVVVESEETEPDSVPPLPNLDHNVLVGDALSGATFQSVRSVGESRALRTTRERYARATGARKEALRRQLARLERHHTLATLDFELAVLAAKRRDLLSVARGRDLFGDRNRANLAERDNAIGLRRRAAELRAARRRVLDGGALPFSFPARFADVAARGGFDLIVGNPPWVRIHHMSTAARASFRRDFEVARVGGWNVGASVAAAGRGFASQIDLAALFVERSITLLQPGGVLALLLPAKLWRSLAGGGLRRFMLREAELRELHDFSEAPATFDAAVYPSLAVATRQESAERANAGTVNVGVYSRGRGEIAWTTDNRSLGFDDSPGAPWLTLPPDVRRAFDRLRDAGTPLATVIDRPLLGVKCGCNEAFVVEELGRDGDHVRVRAANGRVGMIELSMIRAVLRGEALTPWIANATGERIVWTHDAGGAPLSVLPPCAADWLRSWRPRLVHRSDARRASRWWTLFRLEGARDDVPRVVWGDVGRAPRAAVLDTGCGVVPLNSCYSVRCRTLGEAHALAALMNGPVATAWLNALAEPARGGYRRYLGWTMALLPLPADWRLACERLESLGARGAQGHAASAHELLDAAVAAYGLSRRELAPLVAWCAS